MRITIRVSGTTNFLDQTVATLDVSKVTAATPGSPTLAEVLTAVNDKLFDGTTFPKVTN